MIKKIRGVTISVSVYFAALLTFLFALFPGGYAPLGLLCCVLHETGHLIFIKLCGGAPCVSKNAVSVAKPRNLIGANGDINIFTTRQDIADYHQLLRGEAGEAVNEHGA